MTATSVRPQRTLASPVSLSGFGLFGGRDVTVTLRPARPDAGRRFVRVDLPGRPEIPATIAHAVEKPRRTALRLPGPADAPPAEVEMTEHVLAALAGLGVDNCVIEVDAAELPGMDGSALPFVEAILEAGLVDQEAASAVTAIAGTVELFRPAGQWVRAIGTGRSELSVRYSLDYGEGSPVRAAEIAFAITPETFATELAPARTFVTTDEIDALKAAGYGTRVTENDVLVLGPGGPVGTDFRLPDECARHKLLDVVGDLALLGRVAAIDVTAVRSGHALNRALARRLDMLLGSPAAGRPATTTVPPGLSRAA
ncbi:MAG: UDP-3-O-acyl-N-acetylglucosamine deacetylase [Planctomycetota bacterium]